MNRASVSEHQKILIKSIDSPGCKSHNSSNRLSVLTESHYEGWWCTIGMLSQLVTIQPNQTLKYIANARHQKEYAITRQMLESWR